MEGGPHSSVSKSSVGVQESFSGTAWSNTKFDHQRMPSGLQHECDRLQDPTEGFRRRGYLIWVLIGLIIRESYYLGDDVLNIRGPLFS